MYVRARPHVNEMTLMNCLTSEYSRTLDNDPTCLYFNSASAGLKWLLISLREQEQKILKIGVQVLTCESVKLAIIESGNLPVYMDTSPNSFTTLMPAVEQHSDINVLLLSHLYGIANPDYLMIREWCHKHHIILINDLAQTVDARMGNRRIEDYGDYYLYSFAFDKPIAVGCGGMLKVKNQDQQLIQKYKEVPQTSKSASRNLLRKFYLYYCLTASDIYQKEFRYDTWIERLIIATYRTGRISKPLSKAFFRILSSRPNKLLSLFERTYRRLFKLTGGAQIKVQKIGAYQLAYILSITTETDFILEKYRLSYDLFKQQLQKLNLSDNVIEAYDTKNARCGQRITIRRNAKDELIKTLRLKHIESGTYNWPSLICPDADKNNYPNALACIATLINLPTWSEQIWSN
jgi:dTDP-4-amino-4,6-dideoxygalactose transaminase